jgi:hypothetical protein
VPPDEQTAGHDIVVVGGSSAGVEALRRRRVTRVFEIAVNGHDA